MTTVHLQRSGFDDGMRLAVEHGELSAQVFRYPTGVEAIRLSNARGHVIVLPYLGQMIWQAVFDGVDLTMRNMFRAPRPARTIAETYGCFAFHSGLLRNGVPGPSDDHPAHGEMACAPMDQAMIETGEDAGGPFMRLAGAYEYVMGFGAHYEARPSVTLRAGSTLFDWAMEVENLSQLPMDLMYMAHVNFAYVENGRILQGAPFTPERTAVRTVIPRHVRPTPDYRAFIEELAADPSRSAVLNETARYDPEQAFYIRDLETDADGLTHAMLLRPEGDAFAIAYRPAEFAKTVRWLMSSSDLSVAAIALPSTCEPEGYAAESAKGNVQTLGGGEVRRFSVRLGYLDRMAAASAAAEHFTSGEHT